ncbi:MBL fold metallo-hydrolase [bacterium]|nr:MBL fold metallo-hydrolase [bacterium]
MQKAENRLAICPLASGSKGNAWWIESGDTCILVDAGISHRQLQRRSEEIGRNLEQIDHVFITHEHSDHIKGLQILLKKTKPVIWATRGTLQALRGTLPDGAKVRMIDGKVETAGGFQVKAIPVVHDARQPVAYRFDCSDGALAVVTDLGCWNMMTAEALAELDILACESNYDPKMLERGPYPYYLKRRISSQTGHLNNSDGAMLALEAARKGLKQIILGHLSETNNDPKLASDTFAEKFEAEKIKFNIQVATQKHPGPWIEKEFV